MPFPLIPILIGVGTAAGIGIQSYDTFNKPRTVYVATSLQSPQSKVQQKEDTTIALVVIAAIIVVVMLVVLR